MTKQANKEYQQDTASQVNSGDNYSTSKPWAVLVSVITLTVFTQLQMG